jgi:hypothetical protein
MKTKTRRLNTRSEPDARLVVSRRPGLRGGRSEAGLANVKQRLLAEALEHSLLPGAERRMGLAADEAAALAWTTPFPTLFFPALFEEKVRQAEAYADRQAEIHRVTREILAL